MDTSFIVLEREGLPMHVAGLGVLDSAARPQGAYQPAELRRRLRLGMRALPRLRAARVSGKRRSGSAASHECPTNVST
jgi:hypothetical protein